MLKRRSEKGDTLIEVLFAFTILSLIVVGSVSIMNQGTKAAQRSLETTLVSQQIEAQATTLRFLHDAYIAEFQAGATYSSATPAGQWKLMSDSMTAKPITSATNVIGAAACPAPASGSFILDSVNAKFISTGSGKFTPAPAIAEVVYDGSPESLNVTQGIWIEGIRSVTEVDANKKNVRYIDFHIMACWQSPGQGLPQTIATIVRLNEPR